MPQIYTACDGKLMLILCPSGDGWYGVTAPDDTELVTRARSVEEAFANIYRQRKALIKSRIQAAQPQPEAEPRRRDER